MLLLSEKVICDKLFKIRSANVLQKSGVEKIHLIIRLFKLIRGFDPHVLPPIFIIN